MYKSLENYNHSRNYHCRISVFNQQGILKIQLENELLKVVILPEKGSDIVEFLYKPKDIDFLWHSFNPQRSMSENDTTISAKDGNFIDYYSGGWQELFPSYGGPTNYQNADFGTHGEVATIKWKYEIVKDDEKEVVIKLFTRTRRSPYLLEKLLTLKTYDPTLYIEEKITNESDTTQEFIWGHHPVLGPVFLDDSCSIHLQGNPTINVPKIESALKSGQKSCWPTATENNGQQIDLSKIRHPKEKKYIEYGLSELEEGTGFIWNENYQLGFQLDWDIETFPYLWIWEPNCAKEDYPWFGRCYALGFEPWSSLTANLEQAVLNGESTKIKAKETVTTALKAKVILTRGD